MTGSILGYTPNYRLKLVNFDATAWHDYEHSNWRTIDAVLSNFYQVVGLTGVWATATAYTVGQRTIDETTGRLYECSVGHTSTGTVFADYRTANPTHWIDYSAEPLARQWAISDELVNGEDYSAKHYADVASAAAATAVSAIGPLITSEVDAAIAAVIDGAPAALNTLNELAVALGDDANFATTMSTALGNRLRVDAAQGLNGTQQAQGRANLALDSIYLPTTGGTLADVTLPGGGSIASDGDVAIGSELTMSGHFYGLISDPTDYRTYSFGRTDVNNAFTLHAYGSANATTPSRVYLRQRIAGAYTNQIVMYETGYMDLVPATTGDVRVNGIKVMTEAGGTMTGGLTVAGNLTASNSGTGSYGVNGIKTGGSGAAVRGSVTGGTALAGDFDTSVNAMGLRVIATHASFTNDVVRAQVTRAGTSACQLFTGWSGAGTDTEFVVRADGLVAGDQNYAVGADYGEFFESVTSVAIPVGTTVVLQGNKVRAATVEDDPTTIIGVIRPKTGGAVSVVGNTAQLRWQHKYLRDAFGGYLLDEAGERQLNPTYDPNAVYVPRAARPEWVIVGLLGQVPIWDNQPKNPRWKFMETVSTTVSSWLVGVL
jgi:hypothetical protein